MKYIHTGMNTVRILYRLSSSRRSVFCPRACLKPLEMIGSWKFQELRNCPKLGCQQTAPNRLCKSAPSVVVCTQRKPVPCSWISCNFLKNRNFFWGGLLGGSPRTVDVKNIWIGCAYSWSRLSRSVFVRATVKNAYNQSHHSIWSYT